MMLVFDPPPVVYAKYMRPWKGLKEPSVLSMATEYQPAMPVTGEAVVTRPYVSRGALATVVTAAGPTVRSVPNPVLLIRATNLRSQNERNCGGMPAPLERKSLISSFQSPFRSAGVKPLNLLRPLFAPALTSGRK